MAQKTMVEGTVYEIAGGRTMADGTAYGLTKGRTMTGGTGYDIPLAVGKALAEYAEGDIVYLPEDGAEVEFYVACHNYESGLNGSGRTLLVRKDCYDMRAWGNASQDWGSCDLCSWLNGNYLNSLDEDIRGVIGTTKYYYTPIEDTYSVTTRSDAVFQLSVTEVGRASSAANVEGTELPIASTFRIAYLNGSAVVQWTRTMRSTNKGYAFYLNISGSVSSGGGGVASGSRPVFTLPCTAKFDPETNVFLSA